MHEFYSASRPAPLDQADGLRRLFAGRRQVVVPLVANPYAAFGSVALDRLAAALAAQGRRVLVVDAAGTAPPLPELAAVDLAAGIEAITENVAYLPAAGLPMACVDTRGSAGSMLDALQRAAPGFDTLLLHADAQDLARIFRHRAARPLVLGADHPEAIKHAYASVKLLATRCGLLSFDLLLLAPPRSPRVGAIRDSLAGCAETFLGAVLCHAALVDPAGALDGMADPALATLLTAQLALPDEPRLRGTEGGAPAFVPAAPGTPFARPDIR
jgi:flagellar biosynthesis protein FlhG